MTKQYSTVLREMIREIVREELCKELDALVPKPDDRYNEEP